MKTKFNLILGLLILIGLSSTSELTAQDNNAIRFGFKATEAQFGMEVQYARSVASFLSVTATAGYNTIEDRVSGADLNTIDGSSKSIGLGLEFAPFGSSTGPYVQTNASRVSTNYEASSRNSYFSNANCEAFAPQTNNSFSFFGGGQSYTGQSTNLLLDYRVGYRVNIKNSRVSFSPYFLLEHLVSSQDNVVLNSGDGAVNFFEDANLRTTATQINSTSVSVDMKELHKSNRFQTGLEITIRF